MLGHKVGLLGNNEILPIILCNNSLGNKIVKIFKNYSNAIILAQHNFD